MTKDEWKVCEEETTMVYGPGSRLLVDGYEVALVLVPVSPYKNVIMIYVNGEFRGEWISNDCEERRRFMYRKDSPLMSRKQIQEFNKLPKSQQKRLKEYRDRVYTTYSPQYPSFAAVKKQLTANNEHIELIKKPD